MEKKKYEILDYLVYFIIELCLYVYSVSQISEVTSILTGLLVYSFPFIFFYEGLYFREKEYNYAQIIKVILLIFLSEYYNVIVFVTFSLLTWIYSLCRNVFFLQQIYSIKYSENNKTEHRIAFKRITIYYFINYLTLFMVFYSCRDKFFESIIIFGITIVYFFILYCKSITYSPYFCISNIKENYYIPDSNIRYSFIERFSEVPFNDLFIMIPVIVGFLYIKAEKLSFCIISILLCIYIFRTIKNNYSVYKAKIINLYFPLFVHLLLSILFLFILSSFSNIDEQRKSTISNIIVTVLSADLIFNFTSMFILLQENYSKYNSIYLLKNTVTKATIFVSVVIPGVLISLLILNLIPDRYFILYSIFCVVLCISFSIWLLCSLKRALNTTDILLRLMANTNENVVRMYCNSKIIEENNDIQTILKIAIDTIAKKDNISCKSIFYLVLHWLEKYRSEISINKKLAYFESHNNFYSFVNDINNSLLDTQATSIIKQYINEIANIFRFSNIETEYKQYHIFYSSLNKLAIKLIKLNNAQFDELIKDIYNVYIFKVSFILSKLSPSKMEENFYIIESDELKDFKDFYYEPLEKIIHEASKNRNIEFLKSIRLFSTFFQYLPDNMVINSNYLEILHETTHCYSYILRNNNYNKDLLQSVFREYKSLQHYLSYLVIPEKLKELMLNVMFNSISSIYSVLLNNKVQLEECDLEILYEYFFEEDKYSDYLRYLQLFFYVISVSFDYGISKLELDKRNHIWSRVEQLGSIFLKRNNNQLLNEFNSRKNEIISKFPYIKTDYEKWESLVNQEILSFKEYRDNFNKRYGK